MKISMIPLNLRIKKDSQRKIAEVQDIIVSELYEVFNKAVFHGGTAIWRCFQGKRFSEDLDFYLPRNKEKIELLFKNLEQKGFKINKKKISENSLYSELEINRTKVRLEATYQNKTMIIQDYETITGSKISIYSLSAEEFIREKIATYQKRLKVRDLYDIFFLLKEINPANIKELNKLIQEFKYPQDEEDLKTIILEGIVPTSKEMFEYIKSKWESANI
jgi:predicted nucleotidyltransferase component of viral defense system